MNAVREQIDLTRIAAEFVRANEEEKQRHEPAHRHCRECAEAMYHEQWTIPYSIKNVKAAEEALKEMGFIFESSSWFGYICHIAVALFGKDVHKQYLDYNGLASEIRKRELSDILGNVEELASEVRYFKSRWHKRDKSSEEDESQQGHIQFEAYPIHRKLPGGLGCSADYRADIEPCDIGCSKNLTHVPSTLSIERYELYLDIPNELKPLFEEKYKKQVLSRKGD